MFRVDEYVDKLADDRVLRTAARELRLAPEKERFHIISRLLDDPSRIGAALQLANRALRKKEYFENILDRCHERQNWRWVSFCMTSVAPRLGIHRVVDILREQLDAHPERAQDIDLARYYLEALPDASRARHDLERLGRLLRDAGERAEASAGDQDAGLTGAGVAAEDRSYRDADRVNP